MRSSTAATVVPPRVVALMSNIESLGVCQAFFSVGCCSGVELDSGTVFNLPWSLVTLHLSPAIGLFPVYFVKYLKPAKWVISDATRKSGDSPEKPPDLQYSFCPPVRKPICESANAAAKRPTRLGLAIFDRSDMLAPSKNVGRKTWGDRHHTGPPPTTKTGNRPSLASPWVESP